MGCSGSVVLPTNLVFLIAERFTCWDAVSKGPNLLQIFNEKCCIQSFYQSLILKISNPKISRTVIFASNCSKNSKIGWSRNANISKFSVNFSRRDLHVSGNESVSWFIIFDIKTHMETHSKSGACINCCLKYVNCCKINICLNQFFRFWHKT